MSDLYTVERIVDKKINKKGVLYKVKWQGYSMNDCTWEPEENLKFVQFLVQEYEDSIRAIQDKTMVSQKPIRDVQDQDIQGEMDANEQQEDLEEKIQDTNQDFVEGQDMNYQEQEDMVYEEEEQLQLDPPPRARKSKRKEFVEGSGQDQTPRIKKNSNPTSSSNKSYVEPKTPRTRQPPTPKNPNKQQELSAYGQKLKRVSQNLKLNISKPKKPAVAAKVPVPLKIVEMSFCEKTKQYVYLCQEQDLLLWRTRDFMLKYHPDQLIRFYQSKIEFANIPKITK